VALLQVFPHISQLGQEARSNPLAATSFLRKITLQATVNNSCFQAYQATLSNNNNNNNGSGGSSGS